MANSDTTFHESEAKSLPVHVGKCEERYRTLFNRLGRIEKLLIGIAGAIGLSALTIITGVLIPMINRGIGGP